VCSHCESSHPDEQKFVNEVNERRKERSDGSVSTAEIYERAGLALPESDLSKIAVEGAKEIIKLRRQRDQLLSAAKAALPYFEGAFHELNAQKGAEERPFLMVCSERVRELRAAIAAVAKQERA